MANHKDNYGIPYWENREKEKLKKGLKDTKKVEKDLVKIYKECMQDFKKEILLFYDKFAKDNNLSYVEACKLLNSNEYKKWRYDLKGYMELIQNTYDKDIADKLLLELNVLSKKASISRLEELFYQCGKYINEVTQKSNTRLQVCFSSTVKDTYYTDIFNLHKYIGVGASFSKINNDLVKELLAYKWSGNDYSSRIWNNRTKLKNVLEEEMTKMIIRGSGSREVAKAVSKRLDADLSNCVRLVQTEHSYFLNKASELSYIETGVDEYMYLATLDSRTSQTCQSLDGRIFKVSEVMVGINYPPL